MPNLSIKQNDVEVFVWNEAGVVFDSGCGFLFVVFMREKSVPLYGTPKWGIRAK